VFDSVGLLGGSGAGAEAVPERVVELSSRGRDGVDAGIALEAVHQDESASMISSCSDATCT
jgi:hypothetical protein